jgi:acetolactate synthase I/III small subunit
MENTYNISVFTENTIGMLSRLSLIFTRRHVNIESISASPSELEGVHRYTIVVNVSLDQVQKLVGQLEKQIEVLKAFFHLDEEVVYQEIALFKIPTSMLSKEGGTEAILREHNARILTIETEFTIIEKTGRPNEIKTLFSALEPFNLLEFVSSGRVAISKPMKTLKKHLEELKSLT